jgi:hypothetical protein
MMEKSADEKPTAPKLSNNVSATCDEGTRTVSFTDRPPLAIRAETITVPWAVIKLLAGKILEHEAQLEMGGGIRVKQTEGGAAKKH